MDRRLRPRRAGARPGELHARPRQHRGRCRPGPSSPTTGSAPSRAKSAPSSRKRTSAAPPSTIACPRRSTTATSISSTASAATSSQATSRTSRRQRLRFDDMIRTRRARSGLRDLRALPAAQPRAHPVRDLAARQGAGLDARTRRFEFDREKAPWPATAARDERAVAQAREERRAVAGAHRQDVDGSLRHPAQALRARAQARRPDLAGRRVRESDERVRAHASIRTRATSRRATPRNTASR